MPEGKTVHREEVLEYADQNIHVRTLDNQLLMQRFFFDKEKLGDISREIKPPHKEPPIYSTIKCYHKRQVLRKNRVIKQQAEQLQEGISQMTLA